MLFLEPKTCGVIFEHDDNDRYRERWTMLWDGFKIGYHNSLNHSPVYVTNDGLSSIHAYGGKNFTVKFFLVKFQERDILNFYHSMPSCNSPV